MCTDRGFLASKFAAECIAGDHEPYMVGFMVVEKMRSFILAKYFRPEWRGSLPGFPIA